MNKFFNYHTAAKISMILYGALFFFHIILIVGAGLMEWIPYNLIWGGQLESPGQLLVFEIPSLFFLGLFYFLTMVKAGKFNFPKLKGLAHFSMWFLFVYFLLNTVGNVLAVTLFEKSMSLVSLLLSFTSLRLALE